MRGAPTPLLEPARAANGPNDLRVGGCVGKGGREPGVACTGLGPGKGRRTRFWVCSKARRGALLRRNSFQVTAAVGIAQTTFLSLTRLTAPKAGFDSTTYRDTAGRHSDFTPPSQSISTHYTLPGVGNAGGHGALLLAAQGGRAGRVSPRLPGLSTATEAASQPVAESRLVNIG